MKNVINFDVAVHEIPLDQRMLFYLHEDIYKDIKTNAETNQEKLVEITDNEAVCIPFWTDEMIVTGDKELDEIIYLEANHMGAYLQKNPDFGIVVREEVKRRLLNVSQKLKNMGYILVLKIGYRPLEVQRSLFEGISVYYQKKYPSKNQDELYEIVLEMIADPNTFIAPHSTGGAIDVDLRHVDGTPVDMGCAVNHIGEEANITCETLSAAHRSNRKLLTDTFLSEGFAPLASERRHFSYGDQTRAKFYGEKYALYESTDIS